MTGFWALARKELLEQWRTRKFLAMAAIFTLVSVLIPVISRVVLHFQDESYSVTDAVAILGGSAGVIALLGTFLVIIITMGAIANERARGTAAMTLSKPVTRGAFVAAKFLGAAGAVFGAVAVSGAISYLLVLFLFADGGVGRYALGLLINATYVLFIGSITLFWSAMFSRQLVAGSIALGLYIAQGILTVIPKTERFWPINATSWAESIINGDATDQWPGFAIACGLILLLSVGAWAVFRRQEL